MKWIGIFKLALYEHSNEKKDFVQIRLIMDF